MHHIHRYPVILKHKSTTNFLFSPSFNRYIDIDYFEAEFVIRDAKDEKIVARIPKSMLSVSFKGRNKSEAAISALASRIYFFSEKEIRLVTKEGLDCILEYETLKLISATAVDNLDENNFEYPHFYLEKTPYSTANVLQRLMRMYNNIKQMRANIRKRFKYQGLSDE